MVKKFEFPRRLKHGAQERCFHRKNVPRDIGTVFSPRGKLSSPRGNTFLHTFPGKQGTHFGYVYISRGTCSIQLFMTVTGLILFNISTAIAVLSMAGLHEQFQPLRQRAVKAVYVQRPLHRATGEKDSTQVSAPLSIFFAVVELPTFARMSRIDTCTIFIARQVCCKHKISCFTVFTHSLNQHAPK